MDVNSMNGNPTERDSTESKTMDCRHVAEHAIAESYVLGRLTPQEATAFEDHYMECPTCLEELEKAGHLAHGFKRLAAEETARAAVAAAAVQAASSRWQWRRTWLASAAVALVAFTAGLLLPRLQEPTGVAGHANVPVVYLQPVRGAAAAPAHRLPAPRGSGPAVFILELDPPFYPSYSVVIEQDGRRVWSADDLHLAERDTLTLSLGGALLEPGDHLLHLDATTSDDRRVAVGRFAFRVLGDEED